VYIACHGSADASLLAACDETFGGLSNGDDGFCLVQGMESEYTILEYVGDFSDGPGGGWDACGVLEATKDHALVRDCAIEYGNGGD
jgi:hypothetical protein